MAKHIETESLIERSYYTLLPLLQEQYPDIEMEDLKVIIDSCFLEICHYIDNSEEISIEKGGLTFYNPNITKKMSYVNLKAKVNKGRNRWFDVVSTLQSLYGKNKKGKYF